MDAFKIDELKTRQQASGRAYIEFLRVPALSLGLYAIPARGIDPQKPHGEDEVYYVLEGRAHVTVGKEEQAVAAGSIIFVAAGVPHRFHSVEADLKLLVFFGPAEGSRRNGPG
ncbi:MAG: cupin domain-containing protein [Anaerolineales bacterium]